MTGPASAAATVLASAQEVADQPETWPDVAIPIAFFIVCALVASVAIWQAFATVQARAALAREEEYRKLLERATQSQEQTAQLLGEISARLDELTMRGAALERILKEVE